MEVIYKIGKEKICFTTGFWIKTPSLYVELNRETAISIAIKDPKLLKTLEVFAAWSSMDDHNFWEFHHNFKGQFIIRALLNNYIEEVCQNQKIEKDIKKRLAKERYKLKNRKPALKK